MSYGYTYTTYKNPTKTIQDLIAETQAAETEARGKQLKQAELARSYLQQIVDIYGPEGAYGKGMELVLESQKRQDVGKAAQRGISTGLYGIKDYGAEWESTAGTKARATLEDIRLERRAQALAGLAGFEAGVEYEQPDYAALTQAVAAGQTIPSGTYITSTYGTPGSGVTPMSEFGTQQPWEVQGARTGVGSTPATGTTGTAPTPGEIYASHAKATAVEMGQGYGPAYGTTKTEGGKFTGAGATGTWDEGGPMQVLGKTIYGEKIMGYGGMGYGLQVGGSYFPFRQPTPLSHLGAV